MVRLICQLGQEAVVGERLEVGENRPLQALSILALNCEQLICPSTVKQVNTLSSSRLLYKSKTNETQKTRSSKKRKLKKSQCNSFVEGKRA